MENITITHSFKENGQVLRVGYNNQAIMVSFSEQDYSGPQDQTTWFELDEESCAQVIRKVNSFDSRRLAIIALLEEVTI